MKNVRDGYEYTDIFGMNVLSLNRTDLATEEDKANSLDHWARVFKAKTWDELKSLAGRSEAMAETAEMIYQVNADDHARSILRAHRKWEEVHTTLVNAKARAEAERDAAVARLEAQTRELEDQKQKNAELLRQLAEVQKQNP